LTRAPPITAVRPGIPLGARRLLFMRACSLVIPVRFIPVGILVRVRRLGWLRLFVGGLLLWSYAIGTLWI